MTLCNIDTKKFKDVHGDFANGNDFGDFSSPLAIIIESSSLTLTAAYYVVRLLPLVIYEKAEEDLFGDYMKYSFGDSM